MLNTIEQIQFPQSKAFAFITKGDFFNQCSNDVLNNILEKEFLLNSFEYIIPTQTHSANNKIVHENSADQIFNDTDALITNISGKVLCIKTADCAPILLYNAKSSVIAAIHAGWKG
ncbi:MAG: laccase domain-containing protein, partial [Salinivirgaceae bacterium]|nr:laccase domain-containing protein [Salinivirgaceae bacterium]